MPCAAQPNQGPTRHSRGLAHRAAQCTCEAAPCRRGPAGACIGSLAAWRARALQCATWSERCERASDPTANSTPCLKGCCPAPGRLRAGACLCGAASRARVDGRATLGALRCAPGADPSYLLLSMVRPPKAFPLLQPPLLLATRGVNTWPSPWRAAPSFAKPIPPAQAPPKSKRCRPCGRRPGPQRPPRPAPLRRPHSTLACATASLLVGWR